MPAVIDIRLGGTDASSGWMFITPTMARASMLVTQDGAPVANAVGASFRVQFSDGAPERYISAMPDPDVVGQYFADILLRGGAWVRVTGSTTSPAATSNVAVASLMPGSVPQTSGSSTLVTGDGQVITTTSAGYLSATRLNDLEAATSVAQTDIIPVVQSTTSGLRTRRMTVATITAGINAAAASAGAAAGAKAGEASGAQAGEAAGAQAGQTAGAAAGAAAGATAAQPAVQQAAASASVATQRATEAQQSASAAGQSATSAQTSAQVATAQAQAASASAIDASAGATSAVSASAAAVTAAQTAASSVAGAAIIVVSETDLYNLTSIPGTSPAQPLRALMPAVVLETKSAYLRNAANTAWGRTGDAPDLVAEVTRRNDQLLGTTALIRPFTYSGRLFQPLSVDPRSGVVQLGQYLDNGDFYIQGLPSTQAFQQLQDTAQGLISSVGQITAIKAKTDTVALCPAITWQDRLFQPTAVDIGSAKVQEGYFLDNGERWPPVAAPGPVGQTLPPLVTQVVSTTEVRVHMRAQRPDTQTYISVQLRNVPNPERNSDVWRVYGIYESVRNTDGSFTLVVRYSGNGELEMAIKLNPADDFVGGNIHGNEQRVLHRIELDGQPLALVPGYYVSGRFEMFQDSICRRPHPTDRTIFDPNGPIVMQVARSWCMEAINGNSPRMVLTNRIRWLLAAVCDTCYLGMLKNDLALFEYVSSGDDWVERPQSEGTPNNANQPFFRLRSTAGVSAKLAVTRGWVLPGRRAQYMGTNQKVYCDFTGTGVSMAAGTVTDAETVYDFASIN